MEIRVAAYDFFDTIVHRNCHPEVILFQWAKECSRYFKFAITAEAIYHIRKSEGKIKRCGKEELQYSELLTEVYQKICGKISDEDALGRLDEFIQFSYETELEIEINHIFPDNERFHEIVEFFQNGKKIIIISDFYQGKKFFKEILNRLNIDEFITEIYVSSEYGKRKSSGELYKHVCRDICCMPEEIMMCGDNYISDYKVPKELGFKTRFLEYKDKNRIYSRQEIRDIYKFRSHRKPRENPINGYAAEILYFISKLYEELIKDGFEEALFCSREGQYMKSLFDIYQTKCFYHKKIKSVYFYISRRAALVPALRDIECENFDMVLRQFHEITVKDFMKNIGFGLEFIRKYCAEKDIDTDDMITSDQNDKIILQMKKSRSFVQEYDRIRLEQKSLFCKYITSICSNEKKIALVDVGWKGTIQDCIRRILPSDTCITGYYLGLKSQEYGCENPNDKKGILFSDYPEKSSNYAVLEHKPLFYEVIFVADHGPVIGYKTGRGRHDVAPCIRNDDVELRIFQYMERYQADFVKLYTEILNVYGQTYYFPNNLYKLMVKNALWRVCVDFPMIWKIKQEALNLSVTNFGMLDKDNKKASLRDSLKRIMKSTYKGTDFIIQLIEMSHMQFFLPLGRLFCKLNYYIRLPFIKKER